MRIGFLLLGGIGLGIGLRRMHNTARGYQRHTSLHESMPSRQTKSRTVSFTARGIDALVSLPFPARRPDAMWSVQQKGPWKGGRERTPSAWRQLVWELPWITGGVVAGLGIRRRNFRRWVLSAASLRILKWKLA